MYIIPKAYKRTGGAYLFGAAAAARAHGCLNAEVFRDLWHGFCCTAGSITFGKETALSFALGDAGIPDCRDCEYAIAVTETGAAISAHTEVALKRGFMTLLSMIEPVSLAEGAECFALPCCEIRDWTTVKNRMLHLCITPATTMVYFKKYIRMCAVLKYTHVVLEFWGMLKLEAMKELSWDFGFTKEQVSEICREARDMGLVLVPCFNHLGHASSCRSIHGKHVVLDQNPRHYKLFDPDGWTWDITNPDTKSLLRQVRQELAEYFSTSEYFVIGCDEAPLYEEDPERSRHLCQYLNEVNDHIKALGKTTVMWADMLLHPDTVKQRYGDDGQVYTCNCKNGETAEYLLQNLSKDIVFADWQYDVEKTPVLTTEHLLSYGFRVINCPFYSHSDASMRAHGELAKQGRVLGTMMTTWQTNCVPGAMFYMQLCEETDSGERASVKDMPATAALLRKVCFVKGSYPDAGWKDRDF